MPKRRKMIAGAVTAGTAIALAVALAPTAGAANPSHSSTKAIPHSKPAWLGHAHHLGRASGHASVHARVYLAPRGGLAALRDAAVARSTPGTALYRHFLSAAQYHARFDATNASVHAVTRYLRSAGLHVTKVGPHNRYVAVRGDVAAAQRAFAVTIGRYRHAGQTVQAPSAALKVPSSLAGSFLAVTGLDTTAHKMAPASRHNAPPPAGFRNARPCSIYFGQIAAKYQADYQTRLPKFQHQRLSYAPCGYTGPQYRAAYEGNSSLDGSGVTVAITDAYAAPTIAFDANHYAEQHGDGSYAPGQLTQIVPNSFRKQKDCGPSGWYGEETLDVEAVHAMAPGADIRYYGSRSCYDNDLLDTLAKVVNQNQAQLVTNSWGDVEEAESADSIAAYEQVFLQGATEGISFMFSSGDNGDELQNTGIKQADYPTSDPYVTSVGGTSDAIGPDGSFEFQTGWGTVKYGLSDDGQSWDEVGYLYGAGGGRSALFNKPSYQDGVVPGAYRAVPDVGLDADPNTGMLVGETQTFSDGVYYDEYRLGGTSLASPLFAGMTALTLQNAGGGLGLLNPTIYGNATSGVFTDVKGTPPTPGVVRVDFANAENAKDGLVYSVRTFNQDSSLQVARGWDDVTGVGSPNPGWLTAVQPAS